jgi:ADP-heptose:LPS heptosyltransferase
MKPPATILLIRTGALGDIITMIPLFEGIKETFPKSHITLLTHKPFEEVVAFVPGLSRILSFSGSRLRDFFQILLPLRQERFDLVIDLQGNFKTNLLTLWFGRNKRAGFTNNPVRKFLHIAEERNVSRFTDSHKVLLKRLGGDSIKLSPARIYESPEAEKIFSSIAARGQFSGKPRILLHPFSSRRWKSKQWISKRFADLAKKLDSSGMEAVFIGIDPDGYFHTIEPYLSGKEISLVNGLTFTELIVLMYRSAGIITTDSGPLHAAVACGLPSVAIFGPTDPACHCPGGVEVLFKPCPVGPCYRPHCFHPICMEKITVEDVLSALNRLLTERKRP